MQAPIIHWSRLPTPRHRPESNFIEQEAARRLAERLTDFTQPFTHGVVWANDSGACASALAAATNGSIRLEHNSPADHPESLPYPPDSLPLFVSNCLLQAVNDLPGHLAQVQHSLARGGLFLAVFPGGDSFHELRHVLAQAEQEITGGLHRRVIPTVDTRSAAGLLQRSNFYNPVADSDPLTITWPDFTALVHDFRQMGWGGTLLASSRKTVRPKAFFQRITSLYQQLYPAPGGNGIRLTIELVFLTGWKK